MLRVNGLCCVRVPRVLFRDLTFAAEVPGIVQVTGPNGSGKTTLLRALAGLTRAEAGTIEWTGSEDFAQARAYVGHAAGWKDTLSAADNLALAWRLDAEGAAAEPAALMDALERVGLARQRNLPIVRLSQGQKKRLHLARLARSTRRLWLLDEPTSALDGAGQRLLEELLDGHLSAGGIAVIATHQPIGVKRGPTQRLELAG
jgi:heme exporter protein A